MKEVVKTKMSVGIFAYYNLMERCQYNVALPPAILSRFDLVYVMIDDPDDTTDYHIASHIVRVHQKREEAIAPTFTTAQLKRYIAVAKSKKPKLNAEARQVLVDSYVALRRGDTAPGGKVAYRMTVRQLEALIRLSEAIARCHLDDEVSTRHVRLATRLLKTSVISVESTEIDLTEFQDESHEDGDVGENGEAEPSGARADPTTEHPDGPGGKKLVITDEYFQRVTQALVMRLRQHEETVTREGSGLAGMRQRDLIQWYVAQQNEKSNYSLAEEAKAEIIKLKTIIESLVRRERHLIVVDEEEATAQGDDDGNTRRSSRNNRIFAVAPNYVID